MFVVGVVVVEVGGGCPVVVVEVGGGCLVVVWWLLWGLSGSCCGGCPDLAVVVGVVWWLLWGVS